MLGPGGRFPSGAGRRCRQDEVGELADGDATEPAGSADAGASVGGHGQRLFEGQGVVAGVLVALQHHRGAHQLERVDITDGA